MRDLLGLEIGRAAAAFVRNTIGFTIGGVPTAAGHATRPIVVIDRDLEQFASVWAAAGTPNAVFRLTPDELVKLTRGPLRPMLPSALAALPPCSASRYKAIGRFSEPTAP